MIAWRKFWVHFFVKVSVQDHEFGLIVSAEHDVPGTRARIAHIKISAARPVQYMSCRLQNQSSIGYCY